MSEDVFQMITHSNINALKMQLALQCSPLLAGLKISNLLIVGVHNEARVKHLFSKSAIEARVIYTGSEKVTFLLYHREDLVRYLSQTKVREMLKWLGYEQPSPQRVLEQCCRKYRAYRERRAEFPHELGLLLGYPVEDVYGFIMNKGKNDLYTGYWKIYDNLSDTLKLFEQFNQAKELMIRQVFAGVSISEIIRRNAG